jgi:RimJ/RimL family protein N-acetyltransferase
MTENIIVQNDIALIRLTLESDLDRVIELERGDDNAPYIRHWSREKHLSSINDSNFAHFIIESRENRNMLGYIILIGLDDPDNNLEFKRIVINSKGKGFGRVAVQLIKKYAFEKTSAHRLWLEVLENNNRAFELYKTEGFVVEGTHRESMKQDDRYISLIVMSLLRQEYEK